MKRSNSVFNNFSENRFSSSAKKKYNSRNGFLDTQTEFAREFFEPQKDQYHEMRERKQQRNNTRSSKKK